VEADGDSQQQAASDPVTAVLGEHEDFLASIDGLTVSSN